MTLSSRQLRLIAVFAAINVVLVVGSWLALISPQRSAASTAAAQEQVVQTELASLTATNTGDTKQPVIHTSGLYALDTALPAHEDQAGLLLLLDRIATNDGVRVANISPQAVQATSTNFTIQPINLTLKGTYFQLHAFLRDLRLLVTRQQGRLIAHGPLFAVTSVAYTPDAGTSSANPTTPGVTANVSGHIHKHGLLATVGLHAFYYGTVGGATPPAPVTDTTTTTTTGG